MRDLEAIPQPNIRIIHGDLPLKEHIEDQRIYLNFLADAVAGRLENAGHRFIVFFPEAVRLEIENILN
jgi:hypothetical protein